MNERTAAQVGVDFKKVARSLVTKGSKKTFEKAASDFVGLALGLLHNRLLGITNGLGGSVERTDQRSQSPHEERDHAQPECQVLIVERITQRKKLVRVYGTNKTGTKGETNQ